MSSSQQNSKTLVAVGSSSSYDYSVWKFRIMSSSSVLSLSSTVSIFPSLSNTVPGTMAANYESTVPKMVVIILYKMIIVQLLYLYEDNRNVNFFVSLQFFHYFKSIMPDPLIIMFQYKLRGFIIERDIF